MSKTLIDPRNCRHLFMYVKGNAVDGIPENGTASCPPCDKDFSYSLVPGGIQVNQGTYIEKGVSDTGSGKMRLHQFQKA